MLSDFAFLSYII